MALDPLSSVLEIGTKVIERMWPNKADADAAKLKLLEMQQNGELAKLTADVSLATAQLGVNQVEASNSSLFVSGWRPWIGWVCGSAFAYHFLAEPLLAFAMAATGNPVVLPDFNLSELTTVLFGMLGLSGLRTFEKVKGIA